MNKKLLDFIIKISIIGIFVITVKDYYYAHYSKKTEVAQTIIAPNSIVNSDPVIPCQNPYFNFKKGTVWRYKVVSEIQSKNDKDIITDYFTNTISEASPSSLIIETKLESQKEKIKTVLVCKKSGIYGLPFPLTQILTKDLSSKIPLSDFSQLINSISFLPSPDKLRKDRQWQTNIQLEQIFSLPFELVLNNKVVEEKKQNILGLNQLSNIKIEANLLLKDELKDIKDYLPEKFFDYQLAEGIGVVNFKLTVLESLANIKIFFDLVDYN